MRNGALVALVLMAAGCGRGSDDGRSNAVRVPLAMASSTPNPSAPVSAVSDAPAVWTHAPSAHAAWYGSPDAPSLLAISCEEWEKHAGRLVIVRYALADKGAEALFAIQGSKGILRLPVSAVKVGKQGYVWRGVLDAGDPRAEVLLGSGLKATVPGGGELDLPPMGAAGAVVSECLPAAARPQTLPNLASNPATSPADR